MRQVKILCLCWMVLGTTIHVAAQSDLTLRVDQLVQETGRDATRAQAKQQLAKLGKRAVPRLLEHVQGNDLAMRLLSLQCFQYCWSSEAEPVVVNCMMDSDPRVRQVAMWGLNANLRGDDLCRALAPVAQHRDTRIAAPALSIILRAAPDAEAMLRAIQVPELWLDLCDQLPRYQHQRFTAPMHAMLRDRDPRLIRPALIALIYQMDDSAETRAYALRLLGHKDGAWRELGAEYLLWHGMDTERPALERQSSQDNDIYARAAAQAAMLAIDRRKDRFSKAAAANRPDWPPTPARAYQQAIQLIREQPSETNRRAAIELLRQTEPFEPLYTYTGNRPSAPDLERHQSRVQLTAIVCGLDVSSGMVSRMAPPEQDHDKPTQHIATRLIAPVRNYLRDRTFSFGERVPAASGGPFAGTYHVGEDAAIGQPLATVVAVADGVVKFAGVGVASWGGLVVIEHLDADGKPWCSLYGHLGPLLSVRAGQQVKGGARVGALGRAATWENGGYAAHLHFGIHNGPFDTDGGRWVGGYISPAEFESGNHGWRNPRPMFESSP